MGEAAPKPNPKPEPKPKPQDSSVVVIPHSILQTTTMEEGIGCGDGQRDLHHRRNLGANTGTLGRIFSSSGKIHGENLTNGTMQGKDLVMAYSTRYFALFCYDNL